MSFRSMIEINHDYMPYDDGELIEWARQMRMYVSCARPTDLPRGVTFFNIRHHSADCPLGEPPCGWQNDENRDD